MYLPTAPSRTHDLPNDTLLPIHPMQPLKNIAAPKQPRRPTQQSTASCTLPSRPNLMEPDSHVACRDDQTSCLTARPLITVWRSIRTSRIRNRTQRTILVPPRHSNHLLATRPREHCNAIRVLRLCEAERSCDLTSGLAPHETRDLRCAVNGRKTGARACMIEVYAAVIRTSADGYQSTMPGTKGYGFDGSV
jgi:hypothetical protein